MSNDNVRLAALAVVAEARKPENRALPFGLGCALNLLCSALEEAIVEEKVNQRWKEIPIDDVQPGDVARCNGREFPVEGSAFSDWYVRLEANYAPINLNPIFEKLGFTFWRKAKREPLSVVFELTSADVEFNGFSGVTPVTKFQVTIPGVHMLGERFRVTEILDGEDGA